MEETSIPCSSSASSTSLAPASFFPGCGEPGSETGSIGRFDPNPGHMDQDPTMGCVHWELCMGWTRNAMVREGLKGCQSPWNPGNSMWILAEELQNDQRTGIDVMCSTETWKSSVRKGIQLLQGAWGEVLGLFHGEWGQELNGITWMNRNGGIPGV